VTLQRWEESEDGRKKPIGRSGDAFAVRGFTSGDPGSKSKRKRSDDEDSIELEKKQKRFQEKNIEDSDLFLLFGVRVDAVDFDHGRALGEVRSDDDWYAH